ncbi:MAG: SDR family NAD(P)-dependent oxidoreductase [Sulfuritalea sp.]|nr:SDR family NAD(P)-dependent oxidoreductase [Sulfuritalea sp.]
MNRPFRDWRAQRVWIVGASSGIGAALAQALLAHGAHVALSARRADALAKLVDGTEIAEAATVLPLDLGDTAAFASALDRMVRDWGGIDLVVFCAGTWAPMAAGQLDAAAITHTLAVNLQAPMTACATLVPKLLAQGQGAIAFVSSVAGYRGLPRSAAYGTSKAGLSHFAETLHLELAPRGISVYLINPGFVATPMTATNAFRMPALITPDEAAEEILAGLARSAFEIHFPRRFTFWLKLLRLLPYRAYFPLARRLTGA